MNFHNLSLHDICVYIEFIFKEYCNILLESSYIGYDDSNADRKEILSDIMDKAKLNHSFKDDLWMKNHTLCSYDNISKIFNIYLDEIGEDGYVTLNEILVDIKDLVEKSYNTRFRLTRINKTDEIDKTLEKELSATIRSTYHDPTVNLNNLYIEDNYNFRYRGNSRINHLFTALYNMKISEQSLRPLIDRLTECSIVSCWRYIGGLDSIMGNKESDLIPNIYFDKGYLSCEFN